MRGASARWYSQALKGTTHSLALIEIGELHERDPLIQRCLSRVLAFAMTHNCCVFMYMSVVGVYVGVWFEKQI